MKIFRSELILAVLSWELLVGPPSNPSKLFTIREPPDWYSLISRFNTHPNDLDCWLEGWIFFQYEAFKFMDYGWRGYGDGFEIDRWVHLIIFCFPGSYIMLLGPVLSTLDHLGIDLWFCLSFVTCCLSRSGWFSCMRILGAWRMPLPAQHQM